MNDALCKCGTTMGHALSGNVEIIHYNCLDNAQLKLVLRWRNDPLVNRMLLDKTQVTWEQHMAFVASLKDNAANNYWLVKYQGIDCGIVRLLIKNGITGYPGTSLAPDFVGSGIGLEVSFETKRLFFKHTDVDILIGEVYKENKNAMAIDRAIGYEFKEHPSDSTLFDISITRQKFESLPQDFDSFVRLIRIQRHHQRNDKKAKD